MTLENEANKKSTQINVIASRRERKAITDMLQTLRKRMIFDTNKERMDIAKGAQKRAIQGAPDETGATDPIMYLKLDNFVRELHDAIATEAAIADLTMRPNEISKETADIQNNRQYTRSLNSIVNSLDQLIVHRKDKSTSGLFHPSTFEVKQVFDLATIEGLSSGRSISDLIKQGVVVPEYGITKLPKPASGRFYESGKKALMNQAYLVIVEDTSEEGLTHDLQRQIKIDRKGWNGLMDFKTPSIKGLGATGLSAYKSLKPLKPKTKLDILQMAAAGAVNMNESAMAPRPILRPQILELEDPDIGQTRKYYVFTIGGYSGARRGAKGMELAEDVEGMPAF